MQTPKEKACSSSHICSIRWSELLSCIETNREINKKNAVFLFIWKSVRKRVFPLFDGQISSDPLTRLQFYGQRSRFKFNFLTHTMEQCVWLCFPSFFFFFLRMCSGQVKIVFEAFMNFREQLLFFVSIKAPLECFTNVESASSVQRRHLYIAIFCLVWVTRHLIINNRRWLISFIRLKYKPQV